MTNIMLTVVQLLLLKGILSKELDKAKKEELESYADAIAEILFLIENALEALGI